jgi:hypothetical protein
MLLIRSAPELAPPRTNAADASRAFVERFATLVHGGLSPIGSWLRRNGPATDALDRGWCPVQTCLVQIRKNVPERIDSGPEFAGPFRQRQKTKRFVWI